jgi:hypothetical protein
MQCIESNNALKIKRTVIALASKYFALVKHPEKALVGKVVFSEAVADKSMSTLQDLQCYMLTSLMINDNLLVCLLVLLVVRPSGCLAYFVCSIEIMHMLLRF